MLNDLEMSNPIHSAILPHGLWLSFFDEMWDSVGNVKTPTRQQAAMREVSMHTYIVVLAVDLGLSW